MEWSVSNAAVGSDIDNVSRPGVPEEALSTHSTEEAGNVSDIATLAYQLWLERGQLDGDPERDRYEAERLVRMLSAPK